MLETTKSPCITRGRVDERVVRQKLTTALLAFTLALFAGFGAWAGGGWDGYSIALVVVALVLVVLGAAALMSLRKKAA